MKSPGEPPTQATGLPVSRLQTWIWKETTRTKSASGEIKAVQKQQMKRRPSEKENTGRAAPLIAVVIKSIIAHYHNYMKLPFVLENITKEKNREFDEPM